jgi:hypothetical protein
MGGSFQNCLVVIRPFNHRNNPNVDDRGKYTYSYCCYHSCYYYSSSHNCYSYCFIIIIIVLLLIILILILFTLIIMIMIFVSSVTPIAPLLRKSALFSDCLRCSVGFLIRHWIDEDSWDNSTSVLVVRKKGRSASVVFVYLRSLPKKSIWNLTFREISRKSGWNSNVLWIVS